MPSVVMGLGWMLSFSIAFQLQYRPANAAAAGMVTGLIVSRVIGVSTWKLTLALSTAFPFSFWLLERAFVYQAGLVPWGATGAILSGLNGLLRGLATGWALAREGVHLRLSVMAITWGALHFTAGYLVHLSFEFGLSNFEYLKLSEAMIVGAACGGTLFWHLRRQNALHATRPDTALGLKS